MKKFLKHFLINLLIASTVTIVAIILGIFAYYMALWYGVVGIIASVVIITSFISALFYTFLT